MQVNKLINLLLSGADVPDEQAAKALGKGYATFRVFKSTAKDIKLSDLIALCSAAGYQISISGHGITIDPAALLASDADTAPDAEPGQD